MKYSIQQLTIFWVFLSLFITFIAFLGAQGGGSDAFPVFLSKAQRESSLFLFFSLMPSGAVFAGVITIVGGVILNWLGASNKK